jgi:hypothetical protein
MQEQIVERHVVAMCTKCKTAIESTETALQKWNKCGNCKTPFTIFSKD